MARVLVVVALLGIASCTDQYGAYLEVDGRASSVTFDRVEFYFGKYIGTALPSTLQSAPIFDSPMPGALYKRAFEQSDVQPLAARDATFTYYLAANGQQDYLGQYVVAVAFAGDVPVGIAELAEFGIPSDQVWRYPMPLSPFAGEDAELWGDKQADCVRWTRVRDSINTTFAVVRGDDHDCDGFNEAEDCEALEFCPVSATQCPGHSGCLTDDTCQIGSCANFRTPSTGANTRRVCAPTACLGAAACTACRMDSDPLKCLQTASFDHPEINLPLQTSERLCTPTYVVPFALPDQKLCGDPRIELPLGGLWPDGFRVTVGVEAVNGSTCKFALTEPPGGARFETNHHVVLSITDPVSGTGRSTMVIGFNPRTMPCNQGPTFDFPSKEYGVCPVN